MLYFRATTSCKKVQRRRAYTTTALIALPLLQLAIYFIDINPYIPKYSSFKIEKNEKSAVRGISPSRN